MSNTLESWISVDFTKKTNNCVVITNGKPVIISTCVAWEEVLLIQKCWNLPIFITSL